MLHILNNEKLKIAGIPPEQWQYCYISDDGTIWTPSTDESGAVIKSGKELYDYHLQNKDNILSDNELEKLKKELAILTAKIEALEHTSEGGIK